MGFNSFPSAQVVNGSLPPEPFQDALVLLQVAKEEGLDGLRGQQGVSEAANEILTPLIVQAEHCHMENISYVQNRTSQAEWNGHRNSIRQR